MMFIVFWDSQITTESSYTVMPKKKKYRKVEWTDKCQEDFDLLKETCTDTPILAYADYTKPFRLNKDASERGLGAVLYQQQTE